MCMTFYKPLNVFVFALVADLAIYSLQQGGNSKSFNSVATQQI